MINDKRKALGRGLETLLPSSREAATATAVAPAPLVGDAVRELEIDLIEANPYQTRSRSDENALKELAASIQQTGVIQPIVVRALAEGKFQLVAGSRRLKASRMALKQTIPAVVRQLSNEQAAEATIVENLQREDIGAMELARGLERLATEFALTQEQIAKRIGTERSSVANYLRLLKLPREVQWEMDQGKLSFGHAKILMMLEDPWQLTQTAKEVIAKALSVRQTEDLVYELRNPIEPFAKPKPQLDPNVREAQLQLTQALGTKVEIKDRKGKGKIVIRYFTLNEFDRLYEELTGKKK